MCCLSPKHRVLVVQLLLSVIHERALTGAFPETGRASWAVVSLSPALLPLSLQHVLSQPSCLVSGSSCPPCPTQAPSPLSPDSGLL